MKLEAEPLTSYQQHVHFGTDRFFSRNTLPWFTENVSVDARILNLGSGVGMETRALEKSGYTHVFPFDKNILLLNLSKHHIPALFNAFASTRTRFESLASSFEDSSIFDKWNMHSAESRAVMDAKNLGIGDSSFDIVLLKDILITLRHPSRKRVLEESRRIVKDGGYIIIQNEINRDENLIYSQADPIDVPDIVKLLQRVGFSPDTLYIHKEEDSHSKWREDETPQMLIVAKK